MPARRDYSAAELTARLERRREQVRQAVARHRARKHDPVSSTPDAVTLTSARGAAGKPHPPRTPSSLSTSKEVEKVRALLEPFAGRGYEHDPAFWAEMAARHPAAGLAVEAYKMAAWLKAPAQKTRKVKNWPAFIDNWLKKSQRQPATLNETGAAPLPSPGKPPDPAPVLPVDVVLERIDPRVAERALLEARRYTLEEKLTMARNGRH